MIASLGMYDRAETAEANDRLWAGIRDGLRARDIPAPDALTRGENGYWSAWNAADLVLSQTCGFPFRAKLHGQVTLIGTPDYGLVGCDPGYYCSVYVARKGDLRRTLAEFSHARFAYNEAMSQSGWAAPQNHAHALGISFPPSLCSGGHRMSALAVSQGQADIAAIDAVTWDLLQQWDPWTTTLREVGRTPQTPGLPYIAAKGADADATLQAVHDAIIALSADDRQTLRLRGIVAIPTAAYLAVPTPIGPQEC
ncbi:MAG: phosphate/phosphite/phosphonate ABC transporter substrate-binding protein [Microgenomates group bacterium]